MIIRDDMTLLVKYDDENGPHYNCSGGGHQSGETIRQTVAREVLEETAAVVEVGELLMVLESPPLKPDHTFLPVHHLLLFFECTVKPGSEPRFPATPDPNHTDVEWIPYSELANTWVFPDIARELETALTGARPVFIEVGRH